MNDKPTTAKIQPKLGKGDPLSFVRLRYLNARFLIDQGANFDQADLDQTVENCRILLALLETSMESAKDDHRQSKAQAAEDLGDIVLALDEMAACANIDLGRAVRQSFDAQAKRERSDLRL